MLTYSTAVDRPYEPVFRNPDQQPLGMNQQSRVVRQLAPVFDTTSPAIPRFPGYALNQAETTSQANDISTTVFRVGLGGEVKSTDRGRNRLSTAPDSISDIAPNPTTPKKRPHLPDLGPERAETPRRRVNRLSEDRPNADLPASACALFQCWLSENPGSFPEGRQITGFQYLTDIPLEKIEAYFEKFRPRKLLEAETGPGGALPKAGTSPGLARLEADLSSAVSLACNRLRRCSATADRNRSNTRDDSRPFQCTSGCGGDFPTKDSWRKHEEINRPQNTWVCFLDDCENRPIQHRTFYTKSHFKQHFNTVHRGAKIEFEKYIKEWHAPIKDNFNRECGFCGSPFGSWRERINHIAEHFAGRISGGASDMSQWQEPWLGRRKSKPEEEPDSSSDGSGSSDGHPGDPPPPGGYSGGGPGGPTGDPSMEGGPDANQDKGQGGGRHPGRNTENRHERQFRGRRESHQQRNHTEICFNEGVEVFERKDKPPKQEIDLSYIGAWAWGGPQAGRLDLLKTRRRLDAPSQLGEGVEADNEQGFTQNATYPMLPEPGISLPSLAERLPALSAIVGTIAGVIDGQLKCSDVADVELRYRHDGTRLLWKASLVGIFPSRNSSLSSSSVEEWPGERQLKAYANEPGD
ncbi:MAG: hypothetical protein M1813_000566 [Trichoglossum hirsutum]|nr:MAG: hypothetical protein M1813_000566 [Trichoglossum hirsutum]